MKIYRITDLTQRKKNKLRQGDFKKLRAPHQRQCSYDEHLYRTNTDQASVIERLIMIKKLKLNDSHIEEFCNRENSKTPTCILTSDR